MATKNPNIDAYRNRVTGAVQRDLLSDVNYQNADLFKRNIAQTQITQGLSYNQYLQGVRRKLNDTTNGLLMQQQQGLVESSALRNQIQVQQDAGTAISGTANSYAQSQAEANRQISQATSTQSQIEEQYRIQEATNLYNEDLSNAQGGANQNRLKYSSIFGGISALGGLLSLIPITAPIGAALDLAGGVGMLATGITQAANNPTGGNFAQLAIDTLFAGMSIAPAIGVLGRGVRNLKTAENTANLWNIGDIPITSGDLVPVSKDVPIAGRLINSASGDVINVAPRPISGVLPAPLTPASRRLGMTAPSEGTIEGGLSIWGELPVPGRRPVGRPKSNFRTNQSLRGEALKVGEGIKSLPTRVDLENIMTSNSVEQIDSIVREFEIPATATPTRRSGWTGAPEDRGARSGYFESDTEPTKKTAERTTESFTKEAKKIKEETIKEVKAEKGMEGLTSAQIQKDPAFITKYKNKIMDSFKNKGIYERSQEAQSRMTNRLSRYGYERGSGKVMTARQVFEGFRSSAWTATKGVGRGALVGGARYFANTALNNWLPGQDSQITTTQYAWRNVFDELGIPANLRPRGL